MKPSIKNKEQSVKYEKIASLILAILFSVGLLGHVYLTDIPFVQITEFFIFFCNAVVTLMLIWTTWMYHNKRQNSLILWLGTILIVTLIIEITGVKTGLIFGGYSYGNTFAFKIAGVPWIIGWNWALIIIGCLVTVRDWYAGFMSKRVKPLLESMNIDNEAWDPWITLIANIDIALVAGIMATVFDLVLEPVAIKYDYWSWLGGAIPLQNYLAWFSITFGMTLLLLRFEVYFRSRLIKDYLFYQFVFFVGLLLTLI